MAQIEAIKTLKKFQCKIVDNVSRETVDHAIDIAIQSLEADDTVSREDVGHAIDVAIQSLEAWEKVLQEISDECGDRSWDDFDFCSGLIRAKRIVEKHLKEVEE